MKSLLLFIFSISAASIFYSCNQVKNEHQTAQIINPDNIRLSDIIHDSLTSGQIEKITKIQSTFSEVYPVSLEQTITNFKRDRNPDNEIAIWLKMADVYEQYLKDKREVNPAIKKEVFGLILSRSMMPDKEAIANANLHLLTEKEATEILSHYKAPPDPVDVVKGPVKDR